VVGVLLLVGVLGMSALVAAILAGADSRAGMVRRLVGGVSAAVLAMFLTAATWAGIGVVLHPPAIVSLLGWLVMFGLVTAALYTWAVDGPVRWRNVRRDGDA
jgi:hypothetical protein